MVCPKWHKAGVTRLGHLLDENCTPKLLKKAIQKDWLIEIKQFIHQNQIHVGPDVYCYNIECNDFAMDIHKASTKAMYECFMKFKYQSPAALRKWDNVTETSDWHIPG